MFLKPGPGTDNGERGTGNGKGEPGGNGSLGTSGQRFSLKIQSGGQKDLKGLGTSFEHAFIELDRRSKQRGR